MTAAIEIVGLVKTFGSTRALDGLDVSVAAGEVHGYLGPNGAGKSVTIRTLLGLLRHDAGEVRVLGADPWREAVALHRRLAYVPGDVSLWPNLSGGEIIDYFARLRGDLDPVRRDELIERFELDPTKKAATYSKGNRQKVALVTALSSDAELLIFDEPTSGLDPLMESVFQECVRDVVASGRTVFLSSHILAEVERLCHRVTIIRDGKNVLSGSLDELRTSTLTSLTVELTRPAGSIADHAGVAAFHQDGSTLRLQVENEHLGDVMRALAELDIVSLVSEPPTLEELFLAEYDVSGGRS